MADTYDTMMSPQVEGLMDIAGSKFGLCTIAASRARQINAYFNQLGEGIGHYIPPQVHSLSHKPLTIALEEIAQGKVAVEHVEE